MAAPDPAPLLAAVGRRVRERRAELGLTARELADRAGLSTRFVSQLEGGTANIAIGRLAAVAWALQVPLPELVRAPQRRSIALLGLRGAGKSALGKAAAAALGLPFAELDEQVEQRAGMELAAIFSLHGEAWYRRNEAACLADLLGDGVVRVIALSGGVVGNDAAMAQVRQGCTTVWLQADPTDHMARVLKQGDRRPVADRQDAMAELRAILAAREPGYRTAQISVMTSGRSQGDAAQALTDALTAAGYGAPRISTTSSASESSTSP